jgi:tetratricopeptide (TPR) repeat protein
MNKVNYLRKCVSERFENLELSSAAEAGEALLREHWNNQVSFGVPYANDLFNLALVYDEMGTWDRALEMYAESARLVHEAEGDSLAFVGRVNNMAALLGRLGRTEQAYRLYAHMTVILRTLTGPKDAVLADGLYNLANAAADMGRQDEAQRLHEEALRIRREAGGDDTIHSLHSLAFLNEEKTGEKALQYAKEAMNLAREAMDTQELNEESLLNKEHNYYSACFYLAGLHETRSEFENAESLYETVLDWTAAQGGSSHSAYLNVASRLANILTSRGKYREALKLHQEISDSFRETAGESHLFYANNLRSMALLHKLLGEPEETERLMMESIRLRRIGVDEVIADSVLLIEMYLQMDKPDKALDMLVYVLMEANESSQGYDEKINTLAETFARAGNAQLATLSAAMEELCRLDKLHAAINKWKEWEKAAEEE